ncbi:hypothetical protein MPSEU_000884900 [Mayamaea pseudoterrestris]|nr:hypothetical protein MPSEU_000884900 [Mayamaea pseudoterrestris]
MATRTMNGPIVTPVNSLDDQGDWLNKLESGMFVTKTDWEQLANEKDSIPWLDRSLLGEPLMTGSESIIPGSCLLPGKLVRAIGFVQDIFDTEYFASNATFNIAFTDETPRLAERTPLLIAPIPFATPWFRNVLVDGQEKRQKRHRLFHEGEDGTHASNVHDADMETVGSQVWPVSQLNSDPDTVPFLAKLYYDQYQTDPELFVSKLMLNQIVEIIGVLDDRDDAFVQEPDYDEWGNVQLPPGRHLPRIHVLYYQAHDIDSLLATEQKTIATSESSISALANALHISDTVAFALWMTLLSMAERQALHESSQWAPVRTPQDTTLGCASLNVVLPCVEECAVMASKLFEMFMHIVPTVQCHSITAGTSLDDLLPPMKRNGRLVPTSLQLLKGTTLILNIGALQLQQLSAGQVERLQILRRLAMGHKMIYSFEGNVQIPFEADIRIIVLSTMTSLTVLPCLLQVQVLTMGDIMQCERNDDSVVHSLRNSLAAARSSSKALLPKGILYRNILLPPIVLEQAQGDFVRRRELARLKGEYMPSDNDFHRWLTLTRLQARSRRASAADLSDWKRAVELDNAMMATMME